MDKTKNSLFKSLFLSCLRATEFIEKKQAMGLTFGEEIQLKIHLSMCRACNAYEQQSKAIEEGMIKNFKNKEGLEDRETLDQFEKELNKRIKNL